MLRFVFLALSFTILLAPHTKAQSRPLVELFVSQNCPACPKAQANLAELSETDGPFIQLIWVVNYWDYLGEPDEMALPYSTFRQRQYADSFGTRGPYTPQLVVGGELHTAGNRIKAVRRALRRYEETPEAIRVDIEATETGLHLSGYEGDEPLELLVMSVAPMARYGLVQPNAVTHVSEKIVWLGNETDIDAPCEERCVAVVQKTNCGPVVAALEFGPAHAKASADLPLEPVVEQ